MNEQKAPKVGFVLSTKDRADFTLRSLPTIDAEGGFDLVWVDGSETPEGKELPGRVELRNCRLVEVHRNITGGPDNAIQFGLRRLLALGYDYCGLIENDVVLKPGWFPEIMRLFQAASADGFAVGAATVRNLESRVLLRRPDYTINWNIGATMILFTRAAAKVVLATYGRTTARELADFYKSNSGIDLSEIWELWIGQGDRPLGCDWAYCMRLYARGMVCVASIPSLAFNIDCDCEKFLRTSYVRAGEALHERDLERFAALCMQFRNKPRSPFYGNCLPTGAFLALLDTRAFLARWLRRLRHPVRSAKSLHRRVSFCVYRRLAERKFHHIRRGQRDRCWCGGGLLPFKWHSSYGVCAECGCYVNKRPPLREELQRIYSFDLYWHTRQRLKGWPTIEGRPASDRSDGRVGYWLGLIERYGPSEGRVVEVGCAHGVLLAELKARGYECIGVEPDERTAAWATENMGVDVRPGFFPGVELPTCDLFLAFDVIEHSPDPEAFLKAAVRSLSPGGVAILQTAIDRYDCQPPFREAFGTTFDDIEHFYNFTDRALQELAGRCGLEVLSMTERLWVSNEVCVLKKP